DLRDLCSERRIGQVTEGKALAFCQRPHGRRVGGEVQKRWKQRRLRLLRYFVADQLFDLSPGELGRTSLIVFPAVDRRKRHAEHAGELGLGQTQAAAQALDALRVILGKAVHVESPTTLRAAPLAGPTWTIDLISRR